MKIWLIQNPDFSYLINLLSEINFPACLLQTQPLPWSSLAPSQRAEPLLCPSQQGHPWDTHQTTLPYSEPLDLCAHWPLCLPSASLWDGLLLPMRTTIVSSLQNPSPMQTPVPVQCSSSQSILLPHFQHMFLPCSWTTDRTGKGKPRTTLL